MMLPSVAIYVGYLVHKMVRLRLVLIGLLAFVTFFHFSSADAVTVDDALVGSSQKNVTEISTWLREHAGPEKGFILISAASHDSIIFSSGLPMKRFIHEGTGTYYLSLIHISPNTISKNHKNSFLSICSNFYRIIFVHESKPSGLVLFA